jgi:hypothetical protein
MQSDGSVKRPELVLPPAFADYIEQHLKLHDARFKEGQLYITSSEG